MKKKPKESKTEEVTEQVEPDEQEMQVEAVTEEKEEPKTTPLENVPVFSLTVLDIANIISALTPMRQIADETHIEIRKYMVHIAAMDPSHVNMLRIELTPECFAAYDVQVEGTIGVHTDVLLDIMSSMPKAREMILSGTDAENQTIKLGSNNNAASLRVISTGDNNVAVPKIEFVAKVEIERLRLLNALRSIQTFSEYVDFTLYKTNRFKMYGNGDKGDREVCFEDEIDAELTGEIELSTATYTIDYLINILKSMQSTYVNLYWSAKMPLKMDMPAFVKKVSYVGDTPFGHITYYLAPRVQS
jgi:DNA polymerase III sliding clamp (beta) subunit (PCNA family)